MKTQSIISRLLLIIVALALITMVSLHFYKGQTSEITLNDDFSAENLDKLIRKGEYLAAIGDCTSCHTSDNQQKFAGGVPFELPIGTIFAPNITPDKEHGIGNYTLQDFDNAVRYGIRKDGQSLYPAMPFPDYAIIKEDDIIALYSYFMHGVKPIAIAQKKEEITWPLSMRWPLTAWRLMFSQTPVEFDDSQYSDPDIAKGAYLVQGLGHCGSCHTPRGLAINEKSYDDSDPSFLSGSNSAIDGWMPINLRGDHITGLGNIPEKELSSLLWSGRSEHHAVFGGMKEVIDNSLQYATQEDITAIAKYLKSLTPTDAKNPRFTYDDSTHKSLVSGDDSSRGAAIYLDSCAGCHRTDGLGYSEVFPALAGNPSVQNPSPISLINIIAQGSALHGTKHAVTTFVMPEEIGKRLDHQEIADVVTFIRTNWGNQGSAISVEEVDHILKP